MSHQDFYFRSFGEVVAFMGDKRKKTIRAMRATRIERDWIPSKGEIYRVYYHSTPVVTYMPDGIYLRSGGWHTLTTTHRINQFAPVYAYRESGEIWICPRNGHDWNHSSVPLWEGFFVRWDGTFPGPSIQPFLCD